jgi:hypothetical protein
MFRVGGINRVVEIVRARCGPFWLCPRCSQRRQHLYFSAPGELSCRECVGDGAGLVYTVRTISNDDRRERSSLFPRKRKRRRRDHRPLVGRAVEAALAELIKARLFLKPIDLQRVTEAITGAIEYVDGLDRLRLDREERGPSGMGPPPASSRGIVE